MLSLHNNDIHLVSDGDGSVCHSWATKVCCSSIAESKLMKSVIVTCCCHNNC